MVVMSLCQLVMDAASTQANSHHLPRFRHRLEGTVDRAPSNAGIRLLDPPRDLISGSMTTKLFHRLPYHLALTSLAHPRCEHWAVHVPSLVCAERQGGGQFAHRRIGG